MMKQRDDSPTPWTALQALKLWLGITVVTALVLPLGFLMLTSRTIAPPPPANGGASRAAQHGIQTATSILSTAITWPLESARHLPDLTGYLPDLRTDRRKAADMVRSFAAIEGQLAMGYIHHNSPPGPGTMEITTELISAGTMPSDLTDRTYNTMQTPWRQPIRVMYLGEPYIHAIQMDHVPRKMCRYMLQAMQARLALGAKTNISVATGQPPSPQAPQYGPALTDDQIWLHCSGPDLHLTLHLK